MKFYSMLLICFGLFSAPAFAQKKVCDFGIFNFKNQTFSIKATDQRGCDIFRNAYGGTACAVDYEDYKEYNSPQFQASGQLMSAITGGKCDITKKVRCLNPRKHNGQRLHFCRSLFQQIKELLADEQVRSSSENKVSIAGTQSKETTKNVTGAR